MNHIFYLFAIVYIIREADFIYYNLFKRKKSSVTPSKNFDEFMQNPKGNLKETFKIDLSKEGILSKILLAWIICGIFFTQEPKCFIYLFWSNFIFDAIFIIQTMIHAFNEVLKGHVRKGETELKEAVYYNVTKRSLKIILLSLILYTHFLI